MKKLGWIVVPAACVLLACNATETEEAPTEQTNQEKICTDPATTALMTIGSVPAIAVSFDVDCSIEPDESPYSYVCTKLALRYELADGTVIDLSGLDQIDLFIQTDYQPNDKATQLVVQLNAGQSRLSDGLIPGIAFGFPHPLFTVGTVAVGDVDSGCRASDTCAQVDLNAFSAGNEDDYLLASIGTGATVQVTSAGLEKGTRFAFSAASLPLVTPDRNGIQAVCEDGKIHYVR